MTSAYISSTVTTWCPRTKPPVRRRPCMVPGLPAGWRGLIFLQSSFIPSNAPVRVCNCSAISSAGSLESDAFCTFQYRLHIMLLIPAIDLKDGHCVRLKQGEMDDATVFSDDPAAMARHWVEQGARRLHLVDLNGAFAGKPKNEA